MRESSVARSRLGQLVNGIKETLDEFIHDEVAILATGDQLTAADLVLGTSAEAAAQSVTGTLKEMERAAIKQALDACGQH